MNLEGCHLSITVVIAVKNEAINLPRCLESLALAERVVLVDSGSTDNTAGVAKKYGAEVLQFNFQGGYPKKRQWALDTLQITSQWTLLLDADEVIPPSLWEEIGQSISRYPVKEGFFITKGFHFLGRKMRYGGFSHSAILLFRTGKARFEKIFSDSADGLDMEVHERLLVEGEIGRINSPLIHEDFKGLEAYISKHNKYSTWEAELRYRYLMTGKYGVDTIEPNLLGNPQECRRALKSLIMRVPFESSLWFCYHYFIRLGFLEGRVGLIACQIRATYISCVRAKMYELGLNRK